MSIKSDLAVAGSKDMAASQRIDALVTAVGALNIRLSVLSSAQITALAGLTTSQINNLASISASQLALYASMNTSFIAGLSKLPNQSDSNSNLAGVEGFCNNLSDNLQSHGFMS